jgi:hypothetical protein
MDNDGNRPVESLQDGSKGPGVIHVAVAQHYGLDPLKIQSEQIEVVENAEARIACVEQDRMGLVTHKSAYQLGKSVLSNQSVRRKLSSSGPRRSGDKLRILQQQIRIVVHKGRYFDAIHLLERKDTGVHGNPSFS